MPNPLLLAAAGIQLGTGIYDVFKKKGIPTWYQDAIDSAQLLSDEGLTPAQLSKLRVSYAPGVGRDLSERRERIASLNAVRGRTGSSFGNEQILSVPTTEETIAPILADADQRARIQGRNQLLSLQGGRLGLEAQDDAVTSAGLRSIGSGIGNVVEGFTPPDTELKDALISFLQGGGGDQTQPSEFFEIANNAWSGTYGAISLEEWNALLDRGFDERTLAKSWPYILAELTGMPVGDSRNSISVTHPGFP